MGRTGAGVKRDGFCQLAHMVIGDGQQLHDGIVVVGIEAVVHRLLYDFANGLIDLAPEVDSLCAGHGVPLWVCDPGKPRPAG